MDLPFDQLAKGVLRDALGRAGAVETQVEITAAPRWMDVWYVPDPARAKARVELGWLGDLVAEPCHMEPFQKTPGLREVRGCMLKQLAWHHELERRAGKRVRFPLLWVTSTGRPRSVLRDLRLDEVQPGVYGAAPALRIYVLVLSELPKSRGTLLVRLLGSGRVLRDAVRDLLALPDDAWEMTVALPWLTRLRLVKAAAGAEDIVSEVHVWFEQYKQRLLSKGREQGREQGRKQGREQGRKQGRLSTLGRLFERKLGRPLAREERAALADRLDRLGEDRLDEVLLGFSAKALAAWLADPAAG